MCRGGAAEVAEERVAARAARVARGDLEHARRKDHREDVRALDGVLRPRLLRGLAARAQHAHERPERRRAPQHLHLRPHDRLHQLLHALTQQVRHSLGWWVERG